MVKLFSQVIACTDKSLTQFSMKTPVENISEAEVWNEEKSLKSLSRHEIWQGWELWEGKT